jgi:Na+/proline symporter
MLGVFLLGMLTKRRGSDTGNIIAISVGLIVTIFLGGLHVVALELIAPDWKWTHILDKWQQDHVIVSFTWYALVGALAVFIVGVLFPTPKESLARAIRQAELADSGEDQPIHLRR